MLNALTGLSLALWAATFGTMSFYGLICLILKLSELRDKRKHKPKLKVSAGWFGEGFSELELGRHYIIELDDDEDIWELDAKAVKQKRKEY